MPEIASTDNHADLHRATPAPAAGPPPPPALASHGATDGESARGDGCVGHGARAATGTAAGQSRTVAAHGSAAATDRPPATAANGGATPSPPVPPLSLPAVAPSPLVSATLLPVLRSSATAVPVAAGSGGAAAPAMPPVAVVESRLLKALEALKAARSRLQRARGQSLAAQRQHAQLLCARGVQRSTGCAGVCMRTCADSVGLGAGLAQQ